MKRILILLAIMVIFLGSASFCSNGDTPIKSDNNMQISTKMKIKIGSKNFTATLLNNESAKAFMELVPLTIAMIEFNGNEKYYDLPNSLPVNSSNPQSIKTGDLMLYGSKTLVLFYKSFSTSYSYTKLGFIDDTTGLAEALGAENITVSFELE